MERWAGRSEKGLEYKITALGIGSWGERGVAMGIE